MHFDCAGSQKLLGAFLDALVNSGAVRMFGLGDHFPCSVTQRKGNLVFGRSGVDLTFVRSGAGDRSGFTSMRQLVGKRSALVMFLGLL